jgi:hypothetical protein
MRGIVRSVLARVAKSGLPGDHHFYIAFRTDAPGVVLSKRLRERYPDEMTVVLQHRFWDLSVSEDRFEVKLTFDSIPERLSVPFEAVKVFFDPSVPYGLQFEEADGGSAATAATEELTAPAGEAAPRPRAAARAAEPDAEPPAGGPERRADKKPRTPRRASPEKSGERPATAAADKAAAKPAPAPVKPAEPLPGAGPKVVSIDAFRKK